MLSSGGKDESSCSRCVLATAMVAAVCLLAGCDGREEPLAITRIIHQQYRTASETEWPPEWRSLSKLWQTHHPSWRWQFWTDADEAKLFQEHLPEFFELYQSIASCLQAPISKADLSTYAILYVHGGVYADMDTGAVWAVDELLTSAVRATGRHVALIVNIERPDDGSLEVRGSGGLAEPYSTDTDLMMSTAPGHPFFYEALKSIREYVSKHKQTVCERDRSTPTYDLMFLTAWGRLSMLARAWSAAGLNQTSLQFLESLFLREPVDATFAHLALHSLANVSIEEIQLHPPPKSELRLERWLERMLRLQEQSPPRFLTLPLSEERFGRMKVLQQAPDLLIVPVAVSPVLPKAALRELHLHCLGDVTCFQRNISAEAQRQLPNRDPRHSWLLVFNEDNGIWEGSWNRPQQEAFERAAASFAHSEL